jgi:hypothetical protein
MYFYTLSYFQGNEVEIENFVTLLPNICFSADRYTDTQIHRYIQANLNFCILQFCEDYLK